MPFNKLINAMGGSMPLEEEQPREVSREDMAKLFGTLANARVPSSLTPASAKPMQPKAVALDNFTKKQNDMGNVTEADLNRIQPVQRTMPVEDNRQASDKYRDEQLVEENTSMFNELANKLGDMGTVDDLIGEELRRLNKQTYQRGDEDIYSASDVNEALQSIYKRL